MFKELVNASTCENKYISVCVNVKRTGKKILLATYHMPCRPLQKYFLASHIHELKTSLSSISQTNNCKCIILTGDFNITAKSQEYNFLAGIDYAQGNDPEYIKELREVYGKAGLNIDSKIDSQSSHFKLHGSEPKYTNVSEMSGEGCLLNVLTIVLPQNH